MIDARDFVEAARKQGFGLFAGVPCSYLTPFINTLIEDRELAYVSSANEGDAVATAAGAALGGRLGMAMMQNSGLGNAVSPLASLTWPFRIPLLLVVTWRGDPELPDEPQHRLMGAITPATLDHLEIPWELFPSEPEEIEPALRRAMEHLQSERRPYAFLMRKGSVSPRGLSGAAPAPRAHAAVTKVPSSGGRSTRPTRPSRREALARIVEATPPESSALIATTGFTGRELFALTDRPNQLYMVGSMGCASSLGLGLALVRPDLRVVVVDGDGAALMRLGNLATIGAYAAGNLLHVVLDNECHDSTGGQATVSAGVSFAGIAAACGYGRVLEGEGLEVLDALFDGSDAPDGPDGPDGANGERPAFAHLKTRPGTPDGLPRPDVSPEAVHARLAAHLRGIARG